MRTLKCKPITGLWFLPLCEAEAVLLLSRGLTAFPVFCSSEHLPDKWCWKESAPWKPPETPSFEFQVFKEPRDPHQKNPRIFLIIHHLQHSPQLLLQCSLISYQDTNVLWLYSILLGFRYWFHRTKLMLGSTSGYKRGSILVWLQAHTAAGYCMEQLDAVLPQTPFPPSCSVCKDSFLEYT